MATPSRQRDLLTTSQGTTPINNAETKQREPQHGRWRLDRVLVWVSRFELQVGSRVGSPPFLMWYSVDGLLQEEHVIIRFEERLT